MNQADGESVTSVFEKDREETTVVAELRHCEGRQRSEFARFLIQEQLPYLLVELFGALYTWVQNDVFALVLHGGIIHGPHSRGPELAGAL